MIKKTLGLLALSTCFTAAVSATPRYYVHGEASYNDMDFDNSAGLTVGGGIELNEHFDIEIGYNEMGSVDIAGSTSGVDISSTYISANMGGNITEKISLFVIFGHERFEADSRYGSLNESDEFVGLGAAYRLTKDLDIRVRYVSHFGDDIKSANVGVAYYF